MEDRTGSVTCLQVILNIKSGKNIIRITDGQVRGVGIIRSPAGFGCSDDVRINLDIVLGETVGSRLGRSCFQIEQITVFLLIIAEPFTHVIKHLLGKFLTAGICHIATEPVGIEAGFIHTDKADGGEVIGKGTEIIFGVRIKPCVEQLGDDFTLDI